MKAYFTNWLKGLILLSCIIGLSLVILPSCDSGVDEEFKNASTGLTKTFLTLNDNDSTGDDVVSQPTEEDEMPPSPPIPIPKPPPGPGTPESKEEPKFTVNIAGKVVDGPIAYGTVKVLDPQTGKYFKDSNKNIYKTKTDEKGNYDLNLKLPKSFDNMPIIVEVSGGIDVGYDGVYDASSDQKGIPLK